jgi:hypothetical protein
MQATKPNQEQLIAEAIEAIQTLESKYSDLVWYARSPAASNVEYWIENAHAREGAFKSQMRVEEEYPEDVAALRSQKSGDWQHGFNSGMLAAMRYVETCLSPLMIEDEFGEEFWWGGVKDADDDFPSLDT